MGEIFFEDYMFQMIKFSYWHESMGDGSNYLFCSLFSDYIFFCAGSGEGESVGGSCGNGSNFYLRIHFEKLLSSYDSNYFFFHVGMEMSKEE